MVEYGKDHYHPFSRSFHRLSERVEPSRCAMMRGEGILGSEVIEFRLNERIGTRADEEICDFAVEKTVSFKLVLNSSKGLGKRP